MRICSFDYDKWFCDYHIFSAWLSKMLMKRTIFHVIYVTKTNRNFFTFLDPWLQFFVCLWGLCRSSSSVSSRRASFDNTRPALVLRGGHVNTEQIYEKINEVLERRCRVLDMASTVNKSMCNITRNSSLQTSLTNEKDEGKMEFKWNTAAVSELLT